ncbi:hypothetical protein ASPZODRAFT_164268 [Penicilliopsis zonata CBS 506.65]|uniref:Zn(2)-C6 fungal-type domain-containing protein n=1 Tax=Penicilliopsis zonata CBS 506.65 TaxID=1073090 RepID=A0A1L9SSU4_9EURO|nr:hypothetical protein ASPZODRAFT_164268 [Penicilliopsis zonata CBS 506.65]OJJ50290.1 hypothetical protein ASPZODRAFT_164268 [Penicilliopsis zonata CBS 506.65]
MLLPAVCPGMESDIRFVCPRPRNPRACDSCKSHKTRCLPSRIDGACQRCLRVSKKCSFTTSRSRRPQPETSDKSPILAATPKDPESDDLLQKLCSDGFGLRYTDETDRLLAHHQQLFQKPRPQAPSEELDRPAPLQPRHEMKLTPKRARELLAVFRAMSPYFPFVTIPPNATVESLCARRPFLFLAILTVSSAGDPYLQRILNEKFRMLLSSRIIIQGEKSLYHLQGLLVYLAWYPLHLMPMSHQIFKYIQIAIGMLSELNLDEFVTGRLWPDSSHESEAKRACLGCHYLSSAIAVGFRKRNRLKLTQSVKQVISEFSAYDEGSIEATCAATMGLQSVIDGIADCELETWLEIAPYTGECPLSALVRSFETQLADIHSKRFSSHQTQVLLELARLLALVKMHAIPVDQPRQQPERTSGQPVDALSYFQVLSRCWEETINLLEYYLRIPSDEYAKVGFVSRSCVSHAVAAFSRLCDFQIPELPQWQPLVNERRSKFMARLRDLRAQFEKLSRRGQQAGEPPDYFSLSVSIMDLICSRLKPSPEQAEKDIGNHTAKHSRCPMLNGSLKETNYWADFEISLQQWPKSDTDFSSHLPELFSYDCTGQECASASTELGSWPSSFTDWINLPTE